MSSQLFTPGWIHSDLHTWKLLHTTGQLVSDVRARSSIRVCIYIINHRSIDLVSITLNFAQEAEVRQIDAFELAQHQPAASSRVHSVCFAENRYENFPSVPGSVWCCLPSKLENDSSHFLPAALHWLTGNQNRSAIWKRLTVGIFGSWWWQSIPVSTLWCHCWLCFVTEMRFFRQWNRGVDTQW